MATREYTITFTLSEADFEMSMGRKPKDEEEFVPGPRRVFRGNRGLGVRPKSGMRRVGWRALRSTLPTCAQTPVLRTVDAVVATTGRVLSCGFVRLRAAVASHKHGFQGASGGRNRISRPAP